jgi:hypothetical protein
LPGGSLNEALAGDDDAGSVGSDRSALTNALLSDDLSGDPGEYVARSSESGMSLKTPGSPAGGHKEGWKETAKGPNGRTKSRGVDGHDPEGPSPTIMDEALVCLARPLFVWSMLGYGAYAGGILGFSTFGPQFVLGLGYFDKEFTVRPLELLVERSSR